MWSPMTPKLIHKKKNMTHDFVVAMSILYIQYMDDHQKYDYCDSVISIKQESLLHVFLNICNIWQLQ